MTETMAQLSSVLKLTRLEEDILLELARMDKRSLADEIRWLIEYCGEERGVKAALTQTGQVRYPSKVGVKFHQIAVPDEEPEKPKEQR